MKRALELRFPAGGLGGNTVLLLACLLLLAGGNLGFFSRLLEAFPPAAGNLPALLALTIAVLAAHLILLGPLAFGILTKPVLTLVLLLSAAVAYFTDSFGVVVGEEMLRNVLLTDAAEAIDLLTPKLCFYLLLLGVLPVWLLWRVPLVWRGWRRELWLRGGLLAGAVLVMVAAALTFGSFFASFLRTHKSLRNYLNPGGWLVASAKILARGNPTGADGLTVVAADARIDEHDRHRELFVLVVGETARADHFSLNGYARETSPQLKASGAISFTNFRSCGSSTAVSVPCMFSVAGMAGFDAKRVHGEENLLDVLQRAGVNVLWLDNNSDSKGVALRVPYQNFKSPSVNPVCDSECRDEGMLAPLQAYIDNHPVGDIFIVLHQMGNHGPAYYKRYPPAFERFRPACQQQDLSQCSQEEIGNAYDNAILYTDHFLGKVIELLKHNDQAFETAMFYLSDHGESLGEGGLYLHGLPRAIAPDGQLHVPAILWFGKQYDDEIDRDTLQRRRHEPFTHDSLFHTALGFFEVRTTAYRASLDLLDGCRKAH